MAVHQMALQTEMTSTHQICPLQSRSYSTTLTVWTATPLLHAAPMVDDDNMPAPEKIPDLNSVPNNIMMGWEHSNVCIRRSNVQGNVKLRLLVITMEQGEPNILQLFEGLFFKSYLQDVIIPKTNNAMSLCEKLTYGEFLRWLGLWFLMATIIGPQRHEF